MKLIILDRDGVINHDSDDYIKSADEWQPIEGSIEAIAALSQAGYTVAVATNQSGLGRGLFAQGDLDAMHQKMQSLVEQAGGSLAGIFYCPHRPEDHCRCRKPKAGLLDQIAQQFNTDLEGGILVGDSLRDLQAATARACKPVLVKTGKGQKTLAQLEQSAGGAAQLEGVNVEVFENLQEVARALLNHS